MFSNSSFTSNDSQKTNQSLSTPGPSETAQAFWTLLEHFYIGIYVVMLVFGLSANMLLHMLFVRLHRQRLFKHLTPVLLLKNLMDSGAVLFGLPYHMTKIAFKVDLRALNVWLCRAHVFVVNSFMDLAVALRLLICISQISAIFPALRTNTCWHALSTCSRRFSFCISIIVVLVLFKSAFESVFQRIHTYGNFEPLKVTICLNNSDHGIMLFFTIISNGIFLITYPSIAISNVVFLVKIKIRNRLRSVSQPRNQYRSQKHSAFATAALQFPAFGNEPNQKIISHNEVSKERSLSAFTVQVEEPLSLNYSSGPSAEALPPSRLRNSSIRSFLSVTSLNIKPSDEMNKEPDDPLEQTSSSTPKKARKRSRRGVSIWEINSSPKVNGKLSARSMRHRASVFMRSNKVRVLSSIVLTNVFFLLCYLPHYVSSLWAFTTGLMQRPESASAAEVALLVRAYQATVTLTYFFHTYDSLIYVLSYRSIRLQLRLFLCRLKPNS